MFVRGKEIPNPHTAIRVFSLLSHMKWSHLPVAGGIYDQHPDFIDKITYIFAALDKQQEEDRRREDAKKKTGGARIKGKRPRSTY